MIKHFEKNYPHVFSYGYFDVRIVIAFILSIKTYVLDVSKILSLFAGDFKKGK